MWDDEKKNEVKSPVYIIMSSCKKRKMRAEKTRIPISFCPRRRSLSPRRTLTEAAAAAADKVIIETLREKLNPAVSGGGTTPRHHQQATAAKHASGRRTPPLRRRRRPSPASASRTPRYSVFFFFPHILSVPSPFSFRPPFILILIRFSFFHLLYTTAAGHSFTRRHDHVSPYRFPSSVSYIVLPPTPPPPRPPTPLTPPHRPGPAVFRRADTHTRARCTQQTPPTAGREHFPPAHPFTANGGKPKLRNGRNLRPKNRPRKKNILF